MDLSFLTNILKVLPYPWIILCLAVIGGGYWIKGLQKTISDLQEKRVEDAKDATSQVVDALNKNSVILDTLIQIIKGK